MHLLSEERPDGHYTPFPGEVNLIFVMPIRWR